MAKVLVSSSRLKSMLANRHKDAKEVAQHLTLRGDFIAMVQKDQELDFADILNIARYFKKPWSYLLLDQDEQIPQIGQDNRTHENQMIPASPEMLQTLQDTDFFMDTVIELFPDNKIIDPKISSTTKEDAGQFARKIRNFLGVSIPMQLDSKDEYDALRTWSESIQNKGLFVLQKKLPDVTIRAFSITRHEHGIIVVSTNDTPSARIFSLLHEYCHILLHTTGICDLSNSHNIIEKHCNQFAANILLPPEITNQYLTTFRVSRSVDSMDSQIWRLSKKLKVSQAAILIKLKDIKLIDQNLYDELELRRSHRRSIKSPGGDYYRSAISAVGRKLANEIINAFSEGNISRTEASIILGVGEHRIDRFRTELINATPRPNE